MVSSNTAAARTRLPFVAGLVAVIAGALLLLGGSAGWAVAHSQLKAENITVSSDADLFAGDRVSGPLTAYSQASTVKRHVLESTDGRTYADLEQGDPLRETALEGASVRSALLTSVLSFGLALLAGVAGAVLALLGVVTIRLSRVITVRNGAV